MVVLRCFVASDSSGPLSPLDFKGNNTYNRTLLAHLEADLTTDWTEQDLEKENLLCIFYVWAVEDCSV